MRKNLAVFIVVAVLGGWPEISFGSALREQGAPQLALLGPLHSSGNQIKLSFQSTGGGAGEVRFLLETPCERASYRAEQGWLFENLSVLQVLRRKCSNALKAEFSEFSSEVLLGTQFCLVTSLNGFVLGCNKNVVLQREKETVVPSQFVGNWRSVDQQKRIALGSDGLLLMTEEGSSEVRRLFAVTGTNRFVVSAELALIGIPKVFSQSLRPPRTIALSVHETELVVSIENGNQFLFRRVSGLE